MGRNIRNFDEFVNERYNIDEFDLMLESATDVYRRLVQGNKTMLRSLFNEAKRRGYNLDGSMKYEDMDVAAALKLKDKNYLKFWLDDKNQIVVVTLGNSLLYHTFQPKDKFRATDLRYFYPKYMYGNRETFEFVKNGNYAITKFANYLKDKSSAVVVVNIGTIPKSDESPNFDKIVAQFADKYNIGIVDGADDEAYDNAMASNTPLFIKNPSLRIGSSGKERAVIKTADPSDKLDDKMMLSIYREFNKRMPTQRGSAEAAAETTSVTKWEQGGVINYELKVHYPDEHSRNGGKLLPNPALINSIFDKFGVYPVKTFYSEYFLSVEFATAASKKAAQMSTSDPHNALFNSHVNDALDRALADAGPKVKRHAAQVGDQLMLLWNKGDLHDPEYIQFFKDLVMYYTGAEDLPGEQADIFAKGEKEVIAI